MGWPTAIYEFRARGVGWSVPDPDRGDGPLDAPEAELSDVLEDIGAKKRCAICMTSGTTGNTELRSTGSSVDTLDQA